MPYPSSLDVFPTILSSTKRNDPGFELDLLLNQAFDAIEQIEAGLGTGSSNATPTAGKVRRATGTGTAEWGAAQTGDIAANAVTQIGRSTGATNDPTTTSNSYVTLPGNGPSSELRVDLTTQASGIVVCFLSVTSFNSGAGNVHVFGITVDGGTEQGGQRFTAPAASYYGVVVCIAVFTGLTAATHAFRGRWLTSAGTATAFGASRDLVAIELKR